VQHLTGEAVALGASFMDEGFIKKDCMFLRRCGHRRLLVDIQLFIAGALLCRAVLSTVRYQLLGSSRAAAMCS
jgi:hypothetical protein